MTRTALVTGSNRGLGAQTAKELAQAGDHRVIALDVGDRTSIRRALRELADDGVEIDVLVNNAGVLFEGDALSVGADRAETSWRVNVQGPWELMQRLVPGMISRGYGRVVNVSSGGGSFGEGIAVGRCGRLSNFWIFSLARSAEIRA